MAAKNHLLVRIVEILLGVLLAAVIMGVGSLIVINGVQLFA